jgi:PAS domain S-box-containing protein
MSLRAQRLLENVSDVVWLLDLDDFRFLFVSPSVERLRGYTVEEVLAADGADALTPGSAAHLQHVLPERIAAFRAGVEATYVDQLEHPCKGGGTVWAETSTRCGVDEATGHLLVYGTSRDITDRHRAEEERAAREALQEQLAGVMASVPGAVYTFRMNADGSACMPFAAAQVEDLFGLPRAPLAADMAPVFERIHADDVGRVRAGIAGAVGTAWHDEFRYHHPRSGLRWIEGWSQPRPLPDGGVEWHGFAMDVTDRKRTEQARRESEARALELGRALQLKDEFLAMMSHELRTPLNAILGLTEALSAGVYGPVTDRQEGALAQVDGSGRHLLSVLTDILELAQIGAGEAHLERRAVGVLDLVHGVLQAVEASARAKRLRLTFALVSGVGRLVGDERRLRQSNRSRG